MIAFTVIVGYEFGHRSAKVAFTERDHLVQAFLLDRADKPLRVGIAVRRTERCLDDSNASSLEKVLNGETPLPSRPQIYHVIANNHMADAVFAYMPEHKIMIEGDIATAAEDLQWWGDSWLDNIAYRKLDVVKNVPVHMDVMTREEVIKMVNPGIQRVKEFCAQHLAKGNYFQGCPAFVR